MSPEPPPSKPPPAGHSPDAPRRPHDRDAGGGVGPAGVLAFVVELAMLTLLAVAGARIGGGTAVGVIRAVFFVVVAIVVWARWLAPMSSRRLTKAPRRALKAALYAMTTALVALTCPLPWALGFAVVAAASLAWARD